MAEYGYTELDVQYSPRFWVPRMHEKEVVDKHIQITSEASDKVRETVPYQSMRYGPGPLEVLDEFGGDTLPNDAPIYVFIHGGYWQHLNKEMSCYPALHLVKAGIRVVIVGYDLAPQAKMSTIVEEIKRAGTFVMQRAEELQSRGVWYSGFSAGGHLTGVLLMSDWMDKLSPTQAKLIRGFIPISGIFDLKPIVKTYINKPLEMDEREATEHSPASMDATIPLPISVMVIFGQYDSPEFHRQSEEFTKKLQVSKINANLFEVPGMDHFNLVEDLIQQDYILTRKLIQIVNENP